MTVFAHNTQVPGSGVTQKTIKFVGKKTIRFEGDDFCYTPKPGGWYASNFIKGGVLILSDSLNSFSDVRVPQWR